MPGLDALAVGGGVTDPRDARHAVGGLLALTGPTALDVRTGVLHGPGSATLITGTSKTGPKMSVLIGVHVGVGSRGTANGAYLGPTLDAAAEIDVDLAPASGSRIDVVYEKQRDMTSGVPTPDASAGPLYAVLTGTASTGTPAKPDLSTIVGATELGTVTVSAGATSTNGSGVVIANTAAQTVARGANIPVRSAAERDALTTFPGMPDVVRLDVAGYPRERWDGTRWTTPSAGRWADLVRDTGYSNGIYATNFADIPAGNFTLSGLTPGGELEVEWKAPTVTVGAGNTFNARLLLAGAVQDTIQMSTGAAPMFGPARLNGSLVVPSSGSVLVQVQASVAPGPTTIAAAVGGAVVLRYRVR